MPAGSGGGFSQSYELRADIERRPHTRVRSPARRCRSRRGRVAAEDGGESAVRRRHRRRRVRRVRRARRMTTRERNLAVPPGAVLGVFGLGFVAYSVRPAPYCREGQADRTARGRGRQARDWRSSTIHAQKKKFEAARQQSLPADVGVSRTQYGNLLEALCRRADLALTDSRSFSPSRTTSRSRCWPRRSRPTPS